MINWLQCNDWFVSVIGLIISSIIAYHVWFLSKKITLSTKLDHKVKIQGKVLQLLEETYKTKERRNRVYLIDADVYEKYYPSNENRFGRVSHFLVGLMGYKSTGIEFFTENTIQVSENTNGEFSREIQKEIEPITAHVIGLVPYEWIIEIDLNGDDYNTSSLIFCRFKNKSMWKFGNREKGLIYRNWSPFKVEKLYKKNKNFESGVDPYFCEYSEIELMD